MTESQHQALQERAEKAEALLRRLHGWDIMDTTSDGPYWQREIDQLLSATQETCPTCGATDPSQRYAIRPDLHGPTHCANPWHDSSLSPKETA